MNAKPLSLAITGANGRMGRRLVALSHGSPDWKLTAALTSPNDADLGKDAGELAGVGAIGLNLASELPTDMRVEVIIDFSSPAGFRHWLAVARDRRIPMLVGTTGLNDIDHQLIDEAARQIPILQATNTSVGVAVLNQVAAFMTRLLGPGFDIEIVETHHKHKKDAPSGTAMTLADHVLESLGKTRDSLDFGRHGGDVPRKPGTVGMHAVRLGDVIGEHVVHFGSDGERLWLGHAASSRDVFVRGALRAAAWLAGQKAGRYSIDDAIGVRP